MDIRIGCTSSQTGQQHSTVPPSLSVMGTSITDMVHKWIARKIFEFELTFMVIALEPAEKRAVCIRPFGIILRACPIMNLPLVLIILRGVGR